MSAEVRAYYEVLLLRIIDLALREGALELSQGAAFETDEEGGMRAEG